MHSNRMSNEDIGTSNLYLHQTATVGRNISVRKLACQGETSWKWPK